MGEIDGPNFSVNNVNLNRVQRNNPEQGQSKEEAEDNRQITDFADPKAEALGRSMLVRENDSLNNDLKALLENPQIAENSDKLFEAAYAAALASGAKNPYEEAASASTVRF